MAKKTNSILWRLGALVVLAAVAWMKYQESPGQGAAGPQSSNSGTSQYEGVPDSAKNYETLDGCELIAHRHNDGDSFHVQCGAGDVEFRLYYIDAPESAAKRYRNGENNFKRLAQQGRAMGGMSQKQTTAIGQEAKHFVKNLLGKQPFQVITRWENVYGPERRYAFVVVKWDGKDRYLHEILVEKGLGRIHTRAAKLPDGTSTSAHLRYLRKLEKSAKQGRKGAWGVK